MPPRTPIKTCYIVGGTHGNERGGIHIARLFGEDQQYLRARWPSIPHVRSVVANVEACKVNTRYVHEDLNRCFSLERLRDNAKTYEARRAKELNALLGPKGKDAQVDFVMDLHNSTANTGLMLCFHDEDLLAMEVGAYLHKLDNSVKLVHWPSGDQPFLPTVAKSGMTVEIGPVAHGTANSIMMEKARNVIVHALDYLNALNAEISSGKMAQRVQHRAPIGKRRTAVDFPRDPVSGDASAFIHPNLQGIEELAKDSYLSPGQPIFSHANGTVTLRFDPESADLKESLPDDAVRRSKLYPVFCNEAAYFEKQIAFFLYERMENIETSVLANVPRHESKL